MQLNKHRLFKRFSRFNIRFSTRKFLISPFSILALHSSWMITVAIFGFIATFKLAGVISTNGSYPAPFARYEAILPGMPMAALASYPCTYNENRLNGRLIPEHLTCVIFPQGETFDIIHIEIWNRMITEVLFYATNLQIGHIALYWQPMQPIRFNNGDLKWASDNYSIAVLGKNLRYQNYARIIQITANPQ